MHGMALCMCKHDGASGEQPAVTPSTGSASQGLLALDFSGR